MTQSATLPVSLRDWRRSRQVTPVAPEAQPAEIPISKPQLPDLSRYILALEQIWESRQVSNFGPYAEAMECAAREYLGNPHTRVLASCDLGLTLTIAAFDIPRGKKILVPSFTFGSTVNAAAWNGLQPVFCDLSPGDFGLDPESLASRIDDDTGLIMATHIFGNPCRIDEIKAIADAAGVPVVFDAAHAYGAEHKGRKVGSQRDNAVFSLSATKLITSAEGGIVAPADNDLSERLRCLRNYGFVGDYNTLWPGLNAKISELNAALGVLSLEMAEETISLRQRLTARYRVNLESIEQLRFQEVLPGNVSTYNYFAIVCASDRDELARKLAAEGIQTKAYFLPVHRHDAYKSFYDRPLPQTEKLYAEILCLPLFNELPLKTVDWICEVVADHFQA